MSSKKSFLDESGRDAEFLVMIQPAIPNCEVRTGGERWINPLGRRTLPEAVSSRGRVMASSMTGGKGDGGGSVGEAMRKRYTEGPFSSVHFLVSTLRPQITRCALGVPRMEIASMF